MINWAFAAGTYVVGPFPGQAQAIFLSTYSSVTGGAVYQECGVAQPLPPPGVWHTVDLSPLFIGLASPVQAVDLGGFKIITDGSGTSLADLTFSFCTPGSNTSSVWNYTDQAIGIGAGGGNRDYFHGCPVILNNQKLNFAWGRGDAYKNEWPNNPIPPYPVGATYEITVCVEHAYI